jgi:Ca2+-binding RTX toxin-like protein
MRSPAALLVFLAVLLASPTAQAGIARVGAGGAVEFLASQGEANDLAVLTTSAGPAGTTVRMTDATPIAPGLGCMSVTATQVVCGPTTAVLVRIVLGDGSDAVSMSGGMAVPAVLDGGEGNDTLDGSATRDSLLGGSGDDVLRGGGADDLLEGGAGADSLDGGQGPVDTVTYAARTVPLSIVLDGLAFDGELGEGDNVLDTVERVIGGSNNDHMLGGGSGPLLFLIGAAGADTLNVGPGRFGWLSGGPGPDSLLGGDLDDRLFGREGRDSLLGYGGQDVLGGGGGNDLIRGGEGGDRITGGGGSDVLMGGAGRDAFRARDRTRDRLHGGNGFDSARVDRLDIVRRVESVRRR